MNSPIQSSPAQHIPWQWPLDITAYDRNPLLSESEREALESRFHGVVNQSDFSCVVCPWHHREDASVRKRCRISRYKRDRWECLRRMARVVPALAQTEHHAAP
jgi:hypothetical protein